MFNPLIAFTASLVLGIGLLWPSSSFSRETGVKETGAKPSGPTSLAQDVENRRRYVETLTLLWSKKLATTDCGMMLPRAEHEAFQKELGKIREFGPQSEVIYVFNSFSVPCNSRPEYIRSFYNLDPSWTDMVIQAEIARQTQRLGEQAGLLAKVDQVAAKNQIETERARLRGLLWHANEQLQFAQNQRESVERGLHSYSPTPVSLYILILMGIVTLMFLTLGGAMSFIAMGFLKSVGAILAWLAVAGALYAPVYMTNEADAAYHSELRVQLNKLDSIIARARSEMSANQKELDALENLDEASQVIQRLR